jgi:membrane-anchored protein YejM (alkaline phosphatase superfamily)
MLLSSPEGTETHRHSRRWLAVFATLNALIMAGITLAHSQWPDSLGSQLYLVMGMMLHFTVLSFLVVLLTIGLAYILRAQKHYAAFALVLFVAAQLIVITNVKVFNLYHFHLNGMVINLVFSGALLENIAFSWIMWLSIGALLLGAFFGQVILLALSRKISTLNGFSTRHYFSFFFAGYIAFQLFSGCADAFGWNHITAQNRYIPWMPTTTMRSSLEKMGFDVKEKSVGQTLLGSSGGLDYPKSPLHCAPHQQLSILMLVVDSLRFDQFNAEVMPNSAALKTQGLNFENHYSSSNATRYGVFTLFYGLSGNYWKPMLAAERGSVLLDITQQQNYRHFLYGSSKLTFPEFDRTIFSSLRSELQKGHKKNSAANDRDITERFIADLKNLPTEQPFFGFLFFDAAHGFSLPKNYPHTFEPMLDNVNYLELNNDYDPIPFLNLYKTTAHYIDSLIKEVIDQLIAQQRLDNTIVIITSDHGQEFNETRKNFWGHNSNFSQWQTKVPMLILWPGRPPANIETLSSHEDLVPSLLTEAFTCSNPVSDYSTGKSLLALADEPGSSEENRSVLMETWTDRAIMYDNHIYLINPLGYINVVDQNYNPQDQLSLPPQVLTDNIQKMSHFLKKK